MRLAHFFHVYCDGAWEEPLTEHVIALQQSGLAESLWVMKVGFVGADRNVNTAEAWLRERLNFDVVTRSLDGWEQETLRHVPAFARNFDGAILYCHTKGASAALVADEPHELNRQWRRSMTYDCVQRWRECHDLLETHDVVGAHIIDKEYGGPYPGGNFWWSRADYINKLPPLSYESRHHAENWIGLNPDADLYDLRPGWPGLDTFAPERWQP